MAHNPGKYREICCKHATCYVIFSINLDGQTLAKEDHRVQAQAKGLAVSGRKVMVQMQMFLIWNDVTASKKKKTLKQKPKIKHHNTGHVTVRLPAISHWTWMA